MNDGGCANNGAKIHHYMRIPTKIAEKNIDFHQKQKFSLKKFGGIKKWLYFCNRNQKILLQ
jgi:hypothetical protein